MSSPVEEEVPVLACHDHQVDQPSKKQVPKFAALPPPGHREWQSLAGVDSSRGHIQGVDSSRGHSQGVDNRGAKVPEEVVAVVEVCAGLQQLAAGGLQVRGEV